MTEKEPTPVKIKGSEVPLEVVNVVSPLDAPMNVKIVDNDIKNTLVDKSDGGGKTLEPNTTEQDDISTAGQRRINLIWESTQSWIAMIVCGTTMIAGLIIVIAQMFFGKPDVQIPTIFAVAFGTVIGFYFARTNHQAIGGVGRKSDEGQVYKGR